MAVLSVPAEEEGPGGGPQRKGGDAGPPCGEGGHDSLLSPGSLPSCLFPVQFLLWGFSYQEEVNSHIIKMNKVPSKNLFIRSASCT